MELFSISCPTCQARLKVRNVSAIGQILSCPKCQSMVQVTPPPGWQPPREADAAGAAQPGAQAAPAGATPNAAGGFERPFGFEQAEPPAWRIWAFGGAAAAVALIGSVSFFFGGAKPPEEKLAEKREPAQYAGDSLQKEDPVEPVEPTEKTPPKKEELPKQDPPKVDLPKSDPPSDPPKVDPPKADPPKVDPPKAETDPPKVDPPKADPPKVDPPKAETDPPKADPPKADPPRTAPRIAMSRLEVEARVATKVESIQAPNVLLTDAIETLSQISGVRITLDLDALSQAGIPADETVALDIQKTTVAEVLDRILEERGLAYVIEAGQLRVTTRGKQRDVVREESYDVADLCSTAAFGQDLAMLVARVIEPGGWPEAPRFNGGKLEVKHNDWVQRRTAEFLRRLRVARNAAALPQAAADQALATRMARAHDKLSKPLTVNYVDMPLTKIAQNVQSRSDLKLLFDALSLAEAGQSPDAKATYQTREAQPLGNVLFAVLQPFDLTFRIIDEGTLQITSKAAAQEQIEVEFYRVRDLTPTPAKLTGLIEKIRADVFPASWDPKPKATEEPAGRAQRGLLRPGIGFDSLSGCLVVAHHQPAQMQVEDLLDTQRRPVEPAAPAGGERAAAGDKGLKK